jgi:biopolymer transport protein TolR
MAMSVGAKRKGAIADINVTPMADVMIVLLIIFMVTVPLVSQAPVPLPEAVHPVAHEGDRVEIVVRADGGMSVGETTFPTPEALAAYLAARSSLSAGRTTVLLEADRDASYGAVARGLAACRAGGVRTVALAAERRPEIGRTR